MTAEALGRRRPRRGFLERTVDALLDAVDQANAAEASASRGGLLQKVDARVKLAGILSLIVAVVAAHRLAVIGALLLLAVLLAFASRIPLRTLVVRVWAGVLFFTGVIAVPAIFLTPGRVVAGPPIGLHVTAEGLRSALLLVGRAETTATLAILLVLTTSWPHLLAALRSLGVPAVLVVILGMTYRYIFVLLRTAHELLEARRSRMVGRLTGAEGRRLAAANAGLLLSRSMQLSNDVYLAMQSRGFNGEARLLDEPRLRASDWAALAAMVAVAAVAVWMGR